MAPISKTETGEIKNFAFLHSVTTGLPIFENNTTKITEICITIVEANTIFVGDPHPRVKSQLLLPINPDKESRCEAINHSGLMEGMLQNQPTFSIDTFNAINYFLNLHKKPICFVSNYGDHFDFKILKTEIENVNGNLDRSILCVDTLPFFREVFQYPSYKLRQIYFNLYGEQPLNYGQPDCWVNTLISCVARRGEEFVRWANCNATLFSRVTPFVIPRNTEH